MSSPLLKKLFRKTSLKRRVFFFAGDVFLLMLAFYLAFLFRFAGAIDSRYFLYFPVYFISVLAVKLFFLILFRLYRVTWAYFGIRDLAKLLQALTFGTFFTGAMLFAFREHPAFGQFPSSVLAIDYALTLVFLGGFRSLKRMYFSFSKTRAIKKTGVPVLIIGAGDAGEQVARSMLSSSFEWGSYLPIGFIDDAGSRQGTVIHGIPVLGGLDDIPPIAARFHVAEAIIALPRATSAIIRPYVEALKKAGVTRIKIVPEYADVIEGRVHVADLRTVSLEDLLGRAPVTIDTKEIESYLKDKTVLITGAAGSIGSELSRQILRFKPAKMILLDQDESGLFYLDLELSSRHSSAGRRIVVADIADSNCINAVFAEYRPDTVFHAAAYKHVPLMESQPREAVRNNILGTHVVAEAALAHGTGKFVFISTDKAVKPKSVMGMTKRVCEMLVTALNLRGKTIFCSIRFGNVLGSRGSVTEVFKEQIARGGPVTVTHPDMRRYFMVASEAILLILQAGAIGKGGEVFVLDMGEPVKILDLAREMIRLSGREPDRDIPIVFTDPRPGEKLFEDILTDAEHFSATKREKILQAKIGQAFSEDDLLATIERLTGHMVASDIVVQLQSITGE